MQTIIVSLVALVALAVVGRRLLSAFRPAKGQAACPSCGSGSDTCASPAADATSTADVRPLVLTKSKIH